MNTPLGDSTIHLVDRHLQLFRKSPQADSYLAWEIIVAARQHLADGMIGDPFTTAGDVEAYFLLGELQQCLETGLTAVCKHCGEMEGLHRLRPLNFCRTECTLDKFEREYSILDKIRDEALGD